MINLLLIVFHMRPSDRWHLMHYLLWSKWSRRILIRSALPLPRDWLVPPSSWSQKPGKTLHAVACVFWTWRVVREETWASGLPILMVWKRTSDPTSRSVPWSILSSGWPVSLCQVCELAVVLPNFSALLLDHHDHDQCDMLLLITQDRQIKVEEASGKRHRWSCSRRISVAMT